MLDLDDALLRLLPDDDDDAAAAAELSDSHRAELNAALKTLTSQFSAPTTGDALRTQLGTQQPALASQVALRLYTLAAQSVPVAAAATEEKQNRKIDASPQQVESSTFALRLARNIVAGHQDLQRVFWDKIGVLDPLLSFVTAFAQVHDEIYRPLTRAAAQLLSNLLMANEEVQEAFWARYIAGGSSELGQTQLLLYVGQESCQAEQDGTANPTEELDEISSMTYTLLRTLFSKQLFGRILANITPAAPVSSETIHSDDIQIPRNPITGSQRTLLGLFDAYLHSGASDYGSVDQGEGEASDTSGVDDIRALTSVFVLLSNHLQSTLAQLPRPGPQPNGEGSASSSTATADVPLPAGPSFDARTLIGVPQAIVLVVQCMAEWILLSSREYDDGDSDASQRVNVALAGRRLLDEVRRASVESLATNQIQIERQVVFQPEDPVGVAVTLLREVAQVFPAESPFKTPNAAAANGAGPGSNASLPEGHVLSHTGASTLRAQQQQQSGSTTTSTSTAPTAAAAHHHLAEAAGGPGKLAFTYLKRELVRFVGIVSFVEARGPQSGSGDGGERESVRGVQDYVRGLGGLLVVLGMTQLDELNPYIREHAVFALRNLLAGNQANQDFIAQLRKVDES
ncbi:hypothetical protein OC842_004548 [Tilletia horrida]|uniref:Ataxin-10 homolog n=1 Tax=Tilletia horrida TaxID=155126 RepID=A0AAN6GBI4_9BASI|nr:hypothetical protein OC842_004548 [Tilletia horrida]